MRTDDGTSGSPSTGRSTTTSSCARSSSHAAIASDAVGHRGHPPRVPRVRRRLRRRTSTGSSPSRSGTRGRDALPVARPARQEAALLRRAPGQFVFGVGDEGDPGPPGGATRARSPGLDQILTFWSTVPPRTIFEGDQELPPGHSLLLQDGQARTWRVLAARLHDRTSARRSDEADYAEELRALLVDAMRLRMLRSDVPVGAYLSGGLDSTVDRRLVPTLHRRAAPTRSRSRSTSRSSTRAPSSGASSAELGMPRSPSSRTAAAEDIGACFPTSSGTPSSRSCVRRRRRSSCCRAWSREQGYKVVLTGEGSDEVLGGYDIFKEAKVRRFWAQQPGLALAAAAAEAPLPVPAQPAEPVAGVPAGVLPRPSGGPRRARSSRTCRAGS